MDKRDYIPDNIKTLYDDLIKLNNSLNDFTHQRFNRINPFIENIMDWKSKSIRYFNDETITIYDSATIIGNVSIGSHSWIGPFTMLDGSGGLSIGKYCSISSGVMIFSHDTVKWSLSGGAAPYEYTDSVIGDNCFIGTQTVILRGVKIGNTCLVGANSLVNKDLPDYSIAVGIPAKIIGKVTINHNHEVSLNYFQ